MRCQTCGFDNAAEMHFCGRCGGALGAGVSTLEERKVVTVLFADVVASTQLAGALDAEQVRERLGRFFAITREELERFGGTVEKFVGDAVMAVFGLPTTHEDDAGRAVRAALNLQERLRPEVEAGRMPPVRVAVNTGEVVASTEGAQRREFMVTGDVVNVAARLQQQGRPGHVLAGESTYAATRGLFEYRVVPPLELKGKDHPVAAYECVRAIARSGVAPHGIMRGLSSPLVGRFSELSALMGALERLIGGQGGIVGVIGDAGIGKSRLAAEARRQAATLGVRWLEGRTLSFGQTLSYWPFIEIIKTHAEITEGDTEAESWAKLENVLTSMFGDQVGEVLPYLATQLGFEVRGEWKERVRFLDGEGMGRQIFRATRRFVERLAQDRPLALVFEDLHWMDESSSALVEHLLPLVRSLPILVIGIGRPDSDTQGARLRDVVRRHYADVYTEVRPAPLSPADTEHLVRNLLRMDALPPTVSELVLARTEGNPFFIEELVRALIDMKAVTRDASGRWQIAMPLEDMAIPETLRGVIMARIDRLEEELKEVLRIAAVIGRVFFYRVLRATAEAEERLDQDLSHLQQLELIREHRHSPELEYIFKHALTQEATYESILLRRRRELHGRVGEVIETVFADRLEEFYGLLAYHYAQAEDWVKAQAYLFKAADQSVKMAADAEALALYQRAVAAYNRVFGDRWEPLQRASLDRKMAEALFRRGDNQQAIEYLQRSLASHGIRFPTSRWGVRAAILGEQVRQAGHRMLPGWIARRARGADRARAAELDRTIEVMGWIDYFRNQERLFLEALMRLNYAEQNGFTVGIAGGSMAVALIYNHLPLHSLAGFYHHRAVALAEPTGHPVAIGLAHLGFGIHEHRGPGRLDEAMAHYERAMESYWRAGDLRGWGADMWFSSWIMRTRGEFAKSLERNQELLRVGQQGGDQQAQAWGLHGVGRTLWQMGRLSEAVAQLQKAVELFKRVPDYASQACAMADLGTTYLRQGLLRQALEVLEQAREVISAHGVRGMLVTQHRLGLAEAYLEAAEQSAGPERDGWLRRAGRACRAAVRQSRLDAEALPAGCRLKGTYEWLRGQSATAQAWWRRSLEAAERLGATYEQGRTYCEMGRRTSEPSLLGRAEGIFVDLGASFDLTRARGGLHS